MTINSVTLEGNLGNDLEIRHTQSGKEVGSTSLAVSTGYGDRKTTSWYRIALFGNYATAMAEPMRKGARVVVQGEISVRQYEDKQGVQRTSVEVACRSVAVLGGSSDGGQQRQETAQQRPAQKSAENDFDDQSIPF